jgi:hypothetical protein
VTTSLAEPMEFLDVVGARGSWNDNTIQARRTACNKFFDILEESEKNVEYVLENLDVIKARYMNLNKDAAGATVDEYGRRVKLVLDSFLEWKADRSGWEKRNAAKQNGRPADPEKKAKAKAERKAEPTPAQNNGAGANFTADPAMRTIEFPLRNGDAKITIPRDFTMADVKKIAWGLMTYASDFDPEVSTRESFPLLAQRNDIHTQ